MNASGFHLSQPENGRALRDRAWMRRVFSEKLRGFPKTARGPEKTARVSGDTALGFGNTARGFRATAWVSENTARGSGATAWVSGNTARGFGDTAWVSGNTARGFGATAWVSGNTARGFGKNQRPFQRILRGPRNSGRDRRYGCQDGGVGRRGAGDSLRDGAFSSRPSTALAGPFLSGLGWSLCGCPFFGETPLCVPGTRNPTTNKQPRRHADGTV